MTRLRWPVIATAVAGLVLAALAPLVSGPAAVADTGSGVAPAPQNAIKRWASTNGGGTSQQNPTQAEAVADAQNYDWIVALQRTFPTFLPAMRAANPRLKVLAYLNGMYAQSGQGPSTLTYPDAWYARDASGNYVRSQSFGNWLMDPTQSGWVADRSQTCADYVAQSGYDGCYLDVLGNSSVDPTYVTTVPVHPGTTTPWTAPEWMAQMANVASTVKNAHPTFIITGNGLLNGKQYFDSTQGPTSTLIGPLDGANAQGFIRPEGAPINQYRSPANWKLDVDMLVDAGSRSKVVMGMAKVGVPATAQQIQSWQRYALATFLLGTDGNQFFFFDPDGTQGAAAYDTPDFHVFVGMPTAAYTPAGTGAYLRRFTRGVAVVNPTTSATVVNLGGTYRDLDGNVMSSVNLAANTAMVFTSLSPAPPEFDHDGKTELAVYRPASSIWLAKDSSNGALDQAYWGNGSDDIPVPADYDGDSITDRAVYRPSLNAWFVRDSSNGQLGQLYWGASGDLPVPADYNGDGQVDPAVYRPSEGLWLIHASDGSQQSQYWGAPGDVPVPADYDGDGKADLAVYRPSTGTWYVVSSRDGSITTTKWGNAADDVPVPGDYDGDGKADLAVYRPSTGGWFVLRSSDGQIFQQYWGNGATDVPEPADYDGDGRTDLAVYRQSTGAWFIAGSAGVSSQSYWGNGTTDVALPLPYAVRHTFFP